jgi:hypothetical protein
MICADCDSPACRYGGCQGRRPVLTAHQLAGMRATGPRLNAVYVSGNRRSDNTGAGKPRAPKGERAKLYAKD